MQHALNSFCIANDLERSVLTRCWGANKYLRDFRSRAATDKESPRRLCGAARRTHPPQMHIARNEPITHLYLDPREPASEIHTNSLLQSAAAAQTIITVSLT
jgi:hypothetical protein